MISNQTTVKIVKTNKDKSAAKQYSGKQWKRTDKKELWNAV